MSINEPLDRPVRLSDLRDLFDMTAAGVVIRWLVVFGLALGALLPTEPPVSILRTLLIAGAYALWRPVTIHHARIMKDRHGAYRMLGLVAGTSLFGILVRSFLDAEDKSLSEALMGLAIGAAIIGCLFLVVRATVAQQLFGSGSDCRCGVDHDDQYRSDMLRTAGRMHNIREFLRGLRGPNR